MLALVDDLQWWDRPSIQALAFAAHRLALDPVAVLGAARSVQPGSALADLPAFELSGLPLEAASVVLAEITGGGWLDADLLARLHRATAGNPLALVELGKDPAVLLAAHPQTPFPVSTTVATAFAARARALPTGTRKVLEVLTVTDGDLPSAALACQSLGLALTDLAEAESAGLVTVRADRAIFRHPLVRSAVYTDADPAWRRKVHRAVADTLPDDDDRRAWHLAEASLGPDPVVADLLVAAGLRAARRSAYSVAAAAHERAARLSRSPAEARSRWLAAAEAASWAGNARHADRLLGLAGLLTGPAVTAADRTVDADLWVRALRLQGWIAQRGGAPRVARRCFEQAAALAADPDQAIPLLADAIYACYYLADITAAGAAADRIDALLPDARSTWARALGNTAAGAARMLANTGGAQRLRAGIGQLGAEPEANDETTIVWLLTGLLFLRDQDSQPAIARLIDRVRSRAAVSVLPLVLFLLARDDATTDRWSRAEATYQESMALAKETGDLTDSVMAAAGLAWLLARQGREPDPAHAADPRRPADVPVAEVWTLSAAADRELAAGRLEEALRAYQLLTTRLGALQIDDPDLYPGAELTEVLLRLGRAEEAEAVAVDFAERARAKGLPWVTARANRALGQCAADDLLDSRFGVALAAHRHTLDRFEEARTRLAYGERLRRARRRADARDQLRTALEIFEALPAVPWADRAAAELAATGIPVRRRAQPRAAALTPQELQIASHLADGSTIRDVAATLFLSPKTVEYHLRKVYTKLGIRSRAELADLLAQ